jgi:hypothetical protein
MTINGTATDILQALESMALTVRAKAAELGVNINVDINIHSSCQTPDDVAALVAGARALGWNKKSEWNGGRLAWYSSDIYGAMITIYNKEK